MPFTVFYSRKRDKFRGHRRRRLPDFFRYFSTLAKNKYSWEEIEGERQFAVRRCQALPGFRQTHLARGLGNGVWENTDNSFGWGRAVTQ